jgi:hypothetical protein
MKNETYTATTTKQVYLSRRSPYPEQAIPDEEAIRLLAHELWRARGCPIGSPEDDWYIAEQQLKKPLTAASGA